VSELSKLAERYGFSVRILLKGLRRVVSVRNQVAGGLPDLPIHPQQRCMEAQTLTLWRVVPTMAFVEVDGQSQPTTGPTPPKANLDKIG
jgi:hypothetical protein